jgi:MoxR-like ATPase
MLKVLVGYPSHTEEYAIVERMTGPLDVVNQVLTTDQLIELQRATDRVYVDPSLLDYAVRLASATRNPQLFGMPDLQRYITFGASPRASINLILTARALAFIRGRAYALPQDIVDIARDVMRHRLVLSFEALSDDVSPDDILTTVLRSVPAPTVPTKELPNVHVHA